MIFLFFLLCGGCGVLRGVPRRHEIRIVHVHVCVLHAFMLLLGLCFGILALARAWVGVCSVVISYGGGVLAVGGDRSGGFGS